jgi:hypothetical protein
MIAKNNNSQPVGFKESWSISIFIGHSLFNLGPAKSLAIPTITRHQVTDITASFVADPFMIQVDKTWYLFMEIMNSKTTLGEIGLVTSRDGIKWEYQQVVLKEDFHLSYPYVFKHRGAYYMVPETLGTNAIRLYKAVNFPYKWEHVTDLIKGQFVDPTLFRHNNHWWMFACSSPFTHDTLNLFYANKLAGPFIEHPQSPVIIKDNRYARPAGRINNKDGKLFRICQDCYPLYGSRVRAFEILELNMVNYSEKEIAGSPILFESEENKQWNSRGMHHIDAHQIEDKKWLACVDGCYDNTPILKKRAVWIFDDNYKIPTYLSVASFREYIDIPVTLVYRGKPEKKLIDMFKNLGGPTEFIIEEDYDEINNTRVDSHRKNRLLRMEIMGKWPDEQVIFFDGDMVFSEKIKEFIPFIDKAFKNIRTDKSLVWGVAEADNLFYTAKRLPNGKLNFSTEEEFNQCLKEVYGNNWKKRMSGIKYNNGMLIIYNCTDLANAWKSLYLNGLKHPGVNHEDDQVPLCVAMHDLKTQVMEIKNKFNSKGKLTGDYAVYHAFDSRWKPELKKILNGENNLEDYGIIALKYFEKIPAQWKKNLKNILNKLKEFRTA